MVIRQEGAEKQPDIEMMPGWLFKTTCKHKNLLGQRNRAQVL